MPKPLTIRVSVDITEKGQYATLYHASATQDLTPETSVSVLQAGARADLNNLINTGLRTSGVAEHIATLKEEPDGI